MVRFAQCRSEALFISRGWPHVMLSVDADIFVYYSM